MPVRCAGARGPGAGRCGRCLRQVDLDPEAKRFVDDVVRNEPVVMFALEWCEFCWSVRKMFARVGIKYRSVDLDSVDFQAGDRGGKIRAVLAQRTGAVTIPQVFVGGAHIGGCTDSSTRGATARCRSVSRRRAFATTRASRSIRTRCCRSGCIPRKSA